MKDFRMSDMPWNISEEQIGKMFPELKPEQRAEAAENYSQMFSSNSSLPAKNVADDKLSTYDIVGGGCLV